MCRKIEDISLHPIQSKNDIPVVFSSSNYYAPYAGVFIQSLIDCASPEHIYDIIIMEREMSEENKRLLLSLTQGRENIFIRFFNPSLFLPDFGGDSQYPEETYWRIYAPYFFKHYEKIVTVGIDTILKKDIAQLFRMDLGEAYIGAVRDISGQGHWIENAAFRPSISKIRTRDYFERILKLKEPLDYINSDVVVYQVKQFTSAYSFDTISDQIKSSNYLFLDQDVLNILTDGKVSFLSPEWNFEIPLSFQDRHFLSIATDELKDAYQQASLSPAVMHWSGRPKPWVCPDVPYGNEWWDVAKRTPFMGHILARMFDALQTRRDYYKNKYGKDVAVWDPAPMVDRSWRKK